MSNFEFVRLSIPEVILVKPNVFSDERGFFLETYRQTDFMQAGINEIFVQDNHSRSLRNVLRGLHYQKEPFAQGKLVRCIKGGILDVAVDIRRGSPSFGRWVDAELNEVNQHMLYIPPGFAHGFMVVSELAEVSYKCTREYSYDHDRGIAWNDPEIGINWLVSAPLLSPKDAAHPLLGSADNNFIFGNGA